MSLIKKLFVPALIAGSMLLPYDSSFGQESQGEAENTGKNIRDSEQISDFYSTQQNQESDSGENEFVSTFSVSAGPSLHIPSDDGISDFYGVFFGGNVGVDTQKNPYFANRSSISFLTSKGESQNFSGSYRTNLFGLNTSLKYYPETKDISKSNPFLEVGLSYFLIKETHSSGEGSSDTFSGDGVGLFFGGGVSSGGYSAGIRYDVTTTNLDGFKINLGASF
ncbi:MAG: hypothetical protein WDZ69_02930 [Candidatus Pacearchaeota archaeon]